MAKLNKKNTEDVFAGLKHVDKLLNEAASVGNPPKKLSFEEKMKNKLREEAYAAAEEEVGEYDQAELPGEELDEFVNEFSDDEFSDEELSNNEFEMGDEFGEDPLAQSQGGAAKRAATQDFSSEFDMEEPEMAYDDEEFDFTEDEDLMEAIMTEAEPGLDVPEDQEIPPVDEIPAPVEATPLEGGLEMDDTGLEGMDEVPVEGEDELDMMGSPEMGSAPSMGGSAGSGIEPSGMEEPAMDMTTSGISEPEDIDQLIADLVSGTEAEETNPAMFGENKSTKGLGFTDLKTQDVTDKVTMKKESKETPAVVKKSVKESEIKMTKLGDADITGNVKGAISGKVVRHSGTGKRVDSNGFEYEDLGDEDITSGKVKETGSAAKGVDPKFTSLKKENEQKTQALYTLAEKVITLEDEVSNLKFGKFKLEKVNSVLTLLPELKLATREKLVEKFDACKSYAEAKKLYFEVASMVKEHKRGTINEAVNKVKGSSVKYFGENTEETSNPEEDKNQARLNLLMGIKGNEDSYGVY